MATQPAATLASAENQPQFSIQRIYVKDVSFEAPGTPEIFQQEWQPQLHLDLNSKSRLLSPDIYEVILTVTVSAAEGEKTAFLIEVQQAGVFTCQHIPSEQLAGLLGSVCPGILFPYAREVVADLAMRGSFPQLILAPVNFDALYAQQMQEKAQSKTTESA